MDEEPGQIRLRPAVRRALRVLVFAVILAVAVCVALRLLPLFAVAPLIGALLLGQAGKTDKAPTDVSGGFAWWKRRARSAFYTAWLVLILLASMLVAYTPVLGVDWAALLLIGLMILPVWVILRRPPQKPGDPARLTK